MPKNPCADAAQLSALLQTMPDLAHCALTPQNSRWFGHVSLIAERYLDVGDLVSFRSELDTVMKPGPATYGAAAKLKVLLYKASAAAQEECGSGINPTGALVNSGEHFTAFTEVSGVIKTARRELLIVDPYMDETVLAEYALCAGESVAIKLLTNEQKPYTERLRVAASKWLAQYGTTRPLEVRLAPTKALHDRIIFVDDAAVWQLSQSIKDFGSRAPATVIPLDPSLLEPKRSAYHPIWLKSTAL